MMASMALPAAASLGRWAASAPPGPTSVGVEILFAEKMYDADADADADESLDFSSCFSFLDEVSDDEAIGTLADWAAEVEESTCSYSKALLTVSAPKARWSLKVPTLSGSSAGVVAASPVARVVVEAGAEVAEVAEVTAMEQGATSKTAVSKDAMIYLEMAQSTEGTAEERARAFRSYQRLTLTAEEYRKQVAIPLRAAKRKRVDWAKARKIMYASRQSACYDRKRTEEGQFVRRAKKKAKAT